MVEFLTAYNYMIIHKYVVDDFASQGPKLMIRARAASQTLKIMQYSS